MLRKEFFTGGSHISRGLLTQVVAATTGWRNTDLCHHRRKFKGSRLSHTPSILHLREGVWQRRTRVKHLAPGQAVGELNYKQRPPSLSGYRSFINLSMKGQGNKACVLCSRSRENWASATMRRLSASTPVSSQQYCLCLYTDCREWASVSRVAAISTYSCLPTPAAVLTHTKCSVTACGVAQLMGKWNPGRRGKERRLRSQRVASIFFLLLPPW